MTIVVNMVAGPGAGKSTTAAAVFAQLQIRGVRTELVQEYAKDCVWGGNLNQLGNQVYILGKQHNRMWRLLDQVDVIVTDSPLFLSVLYGRRECDAFKDLALQLFRSMDNLTFFLKRTMPYDAVGRTQNEEEAHHIDGLLRQLLYQHAVDHEIVSVNGETATFISDRTIDTLRSRAT